LNIHVTAALHVFFVTCAAKFYHHGIVLQYFATEPQMSCSLASLGIASCQGRSTFRHTLWWYSIAHFLFLWPLDVLHQFACISSRYDSLHDKSALQQRIATAHCMTAHCMTAHCMTAHCMAAHCMTAQCIALHAIVAPHDIFFRHCHCLFLYTQRNW
jgi:hypothetical protein